MEDYIKIINSTYKLLEFFPDNDPLKYKAKEKTLAILENLTLIEDFKGWTSLKKERAASELLDDIEILKKYLQLGKYQGWVGGINFLILLKEYDRVKSELHPIKPGIGVVLESEKPPANSQTREVKVKNINPNKFAVTSPVQKEVNSENSKSLIRQGKILQVINSMGRAQVSDIIKEIPNVTKRTLRRDLDELLKKAKIVRSGEWNKVSYQVS